MGVRRGVRRSAGLRGPVALGAAAAVLATMLGSVPASAEPSDVPSAVPSDVPSAVPSDVPTAVPSAVPTDAPTAVPTDAPADPTNTGTNPSADTPTSNPASAAAQNLPSATSGAWVGPWATTPIPPVQVPTAAVAAMALQSPTAPASPSDTAMIAKSQIALSPTEPKQVSTKALSTAGGLVSSKISTVPDDNETRAGITKAGTKLVITSDASKLSAADYQAMTKKAPNLTRALFPVPMVGPNGEHTKAAMFRATFQAGEKVRVQGTVSPSAMKKGAYLVIEKAPVTPDGKVGRFIRTHTIKPSKKDGKYLQDIPVRQGLEMVRHRLLMKKTTVKRDINWAALEARAEAILEADEAKALAALKAKLIADAKAELTKAEAALLAKLKIALVNEFRSSVLGHLALVGAGVMTVNLTSMKGSRDITINLANWPQNGCDPTTTENCTYSSIAIPFPDEATKTATFIAPTSFNTIAFSASGEHGEKYTVNWSEHPKHTTACSKVQPTPSELAKYGATWDFNMNTGVHMKGYLGGTPADYEWYGQMSQQQGDAKKNALPEGCGFLARQGFGTWWTSLSGWEKILIEVAAGIVLTATGVGIFVAADGLSMLVGADYVESVADTMNEAIRVAIEAGTTTLTEDDMLIEGQDYVIQDVVIDGEESGVKSLRRTLRGWLKQALKAQAYSDVADAFMAVDPSAIDGTIYDSLESFSAYESNEIEADLDGYLAEEVSSELAGLDSFDSFLDADISDAAISDAETFASNEVGTIVVS